MPGMTRLLLAAAAALALAAVPVPADAGLCGGSVADPVCALDPRPVVDCFQPPPHWVELCV